MSLEIKTDYYDVLVFSHNDMDGIAAAFLVKYFYDNNLENPNWQPNVTVQLCDYKEKYTFEWFKNKTNEFINKTLNYNPEAKIKIFMLDYAIQPNDLMMKFSNWLQMKKLDLIWIDHHFTAIQNLNHYNIPGLRNMDYSGALNTWKYLTGDKEPAPKFIKMVSDFDIWNFDSQEYKNDCLKLNYFITSFELELNNNDSDIVKVLKTLLDDTNEIEGTALRLGSVIFNFMKAKYIKNSSNIYQTEWNKYRCFVINSSEPGSFEFDYCDVPEDIDLLVKWYFDGKRYDYSVYARKDGIDVGGLCEKYLNGGGHEKCGGGSLDKNIFS